MSETLKELRQREREQGATLQKTRDRIKDIENAERLPVLRKRYEGKYYTFTNSGGGKTWLLYVYCRKVINTHFQVAVVDMFETTPQGCELKVKTNGGEYLFQTPITKRKWDRALRAFKQRVERLGKKEDAYGGSDA